MRMIWAEPNVGWLKSPQIRTELNSIGSHTPSYCLLQQTCINSIYLENALVYKCIHTDMKAEGCVITNRLKHCHILKRKCRWAKQAVPWEFPPHPNPSSLLKK